MVIFGGSDELGGDGKKRFGKKWPPRRAGGSRRPGSCTDQVENKVMARSDATGRVRKLIIHLLIDLRPNYISQACHGARWRRPSNAEDHAASWRCGNTSPSKRYYGSSSGLPVSLGLRAGLIRLSGSASARGGGSGPSGAQPPSGRTARGVGVEAPEAPVGSAECRRSPLSGCSAWFGRPSADMDPLTTRPKRSQRSTLRDVRHLA